jgi:arylsulfatase A-like enzyme
MRGDPGARSPHAAFFYHHVSRLEAVRAGRWKLSLKRDDQNRPISGQCELYDLEADVGETTNVADAHAAVVSELKERMQACREDIGDALTGTKGANCRPIGRVAVPKPLTVHKANAPYLAPEYDLEDCG